MFSKAKFCARSLRNFGVSKSFSFTSSRSFSSIYKISDDINFEEVFNKELFSIEHCSKTAIGSIYVLNLLSEALGIKFEESLIYLPELTNFFNIIFRWDCHNENVFKQQDYNLNQVIDNVKDFNNQDNVNINALYLKSYLKSIDCYTPRMEQGLLEFDLYCQYEGILCSLMNQENPNTTEINFTKELVHKVTYFRLSDLRMFLDMIHIRHYGNDNISPGLLKFIDCKHFLGEIEDDLHGYHREIEENTFNIYRCYVKLFGENAKNELTKDLEEIEGRMQKLIDSKEVDADMANHFTEREIFLGHYKDHQNNYRYPWRIPDPIVDETQYLKAN